MLPQLALEVSNVFFLFFLVFICVFLDSHGEKNMAETQGTIGRVKPKMLLSPVLNLDKN